MIVREFGAGDYCDWCGKEGQYAYLYAEVCLCSKCAATERGSGVNAKNELLIAAHYGILAGVDASTLTQGIRGMVAENTELRKRVLDLEARAFTPTLTTAPQERDDEAQEA